MGAPEKGDGVVFVTGRKRMRTENLRKLQVLRDQVQSEYESKKDATSNLARENERLRLKLDMLESFITQALQMTLPDSDDSFEELRLVALAYPDICPTVRSLLMGMAPAVAADGTVNPKDSNGLQPLCAGGK
jgi:hypothetical protein